MRKLICYVAISEDGYIADKEGGVSWLDKYQNDYGYDTFLARIDTLLMGRKTYEQVLGFGSWPYADKDCLVLSEKRTEGPHADFTDDIKQLEKLKEKDGKDIWLVGGAQLIQGLKEAIDEYIITVVPEMLGDGIALGIDLNELEIQDEKDYPDGVVQKRYY